MFCCKASKERQQPTQQAPPTEASDPAPGSSGNEPSDEENTRAGAPSTDDANDINDTDNSAPREIATDEPNGANDESTNAGDGKSAEGAAGAEGTDRTLAIDNEEPNSDNGVGTYEEQPAVEHSGDGEPTVPNSDKGVDGSSSIASPTRNTASEKEDANSPSGAQDGERERSDSETDENTAEFFRNRSRRYSSVVDIYPRTALPPKQTPRRTSEYRQRRSSREVSEDRHDQRRPSFTNRDGEVKESVGVSPMSSEDQDGLVLSFSSPPDSLPNMSTNRRDRDRRLVNESTSTPRRNSAAWVHEDVSVQTPSKDLSDAVTQTDKKVLRSPEQITTAVEHMVSPYPQETIDRELSVSPRDKGQGPSQAQQQQQSRTSEGARERRRSFGGSLSRSMDTAAESSFEPTTQALLQSTDTSSSSPNSESKQPEAFEENKNPETQNEKALSSERERRSSAAPSVGSRLRSKDEASLTSRSKASMSGSTKEIDDLRSPVQSSRKASSVHDSDARQQSATGDNNGGMRPLLAVVNGGPAQSSKEPEPSAPPSCVVAVTSQTPSRELTSTINASREAAVALTKSRKADRCRALDHLPSSGPWLRGNALIDAVVRVYPTFDRDDIAAAIQSFATAGDGSNANGPLLSHHAFTACGKEREHQEPWLSSHGAYLSAVVKSTGTVQDKRDTSPARKKASGTPSRVNPYLLPLLVRSMVVPDDVAAYLGKFITTSPEPATIAYEALIESAPSAPSDPKNGQTKPSDSGRTTSQQPPSAKVARSPGRRRSSTLSPLPAGAAAPSTSILSPMQSFRKDGRSSLGTTDGLPAPMTHQGQGVMLRGQVPYHTVLSTKPWVEGLDARLVAMHAALDLTSEAATAVAMVISGGRRFAALDTDDFANHHRECQGRRSSERSPDPIRKESDVTGRTGVLPALSAAKDQRNCEAMATPQSGHHDHHDHHSSMHDSIQRGSRLSAARASQERSQERSGSSRLAITPSVARRLDTGSPQRGDGVFESRTGKTNRGEETTVTPRSVVSCLRRNCALRSTAATDRQGLGQREEGHGATLLSVHTPGQLSVLHEVLSIHSLLELSVSTDRFVFNQHYTHALQRTQIFQDSECVERLGRLKNLRHLHVQSADFGSTGVGFAAIARLPNLSVLRLPMASFSSCQRQFQELAALGQKRSNGAALVHLDLSNANVSMKEMSVIGEFEELTMLDLSGCPQVTDKAFRFLLNMKHLTTIGLGGTKVGASVVKVLQAQIPGLNIQ